MIACLRIPQFAAAVEIQHARLAADCVLVVIHTPYVVAMSHAAQVAGVTLGMTERHVRLRCPQAAVVQANPLRYRAAAEDVTALLATCSNRVVADDAVYPTADGDARWFADLGVGDLAATIDVVTVMRQLLRQRGWDQATIGVAATRFTAQCRAATLTPGTVDCVPPGQESRFLAPLPIALLPLPADVRTRFEDLGLRTIGQLAALSPAAITDQCGDGGRFIHLLCRGRDTHPIPRYVPAPMIGVRRRFDGPVTDRRALELTVVDLAARLATRLDRRGASAHGVGLTLACETTLPLTERLVLDAPTTQPETLRLALRRLLGRVAVADGVESLAAFCTDLTTLATGQLLLYEDLPTSATLRLVTRGSFLARFGPQRLFRPRVRDPDARLPEQRYGFEDLATV